jgi:hypothetical protein
MCQLTPRPMRGHHVTVVSTWDTENLLTEWPILSSEEPQSRQGQTFPVCLLSVKQLRGGEHSGWMQERGAPYSLMNPSTLESSLYSMEEQFLLKFSLCSPYLQMLLSPAPFCTLKTLWEPVPHLQCSKHFSSSGLCFPDPEPLSAVLGSWYMLRNICWMMNELMSDRQMYGHPKRQAWFMTWTGVQNWLKSNTFISYILSSNFEITWINFDSLLKRSDSQSLFHYIKGLISFQDNLWVL